VVPKDVRELIRMLSRARDTAPRYLLRDRDRIFGQDFVDQVRAMGIKQVLSAPRSPWQRAYVERLIGTLRRQCLDHLIVLHERSLHRHPRTFMDYYHRNRVHLALEKDTPEPRPIQPLEFGRIVSIPVLRAASPIRTARRLSHPTTYEYPSECCSFRSALVFAIARIKSHSGLSLLHPNSSDQ
jgi:hypothetical protein